MGLCGMYYMAKQLQCSVRFKFQTARSFTVCSLGGTRTELGRWFEFQCGSWWRNLEPLLRLSIRGQYGGCWWKWKIGDRIAQMDLDDLVSLLLPGIWAVKLAVSGMEKRLTDKLLLSHSSSWCLPLSPFFSLFLILNSWFISVHKVKVSSLRHPKSVC